jgi:long-chain acyl-CoA synthetase
MDSKDRNMEKIWLKSYPPGIPAEIGPLQYTSLGDFFVQAVQEYNELPCLENMGVVLSYADCGRISKQIAAYLMHDLGLKKGDRIALMLPNCLQYPIMMYAAFRAGLIVVNVNPLYTVPEFVHQVNDAQASAVVVLANMAKTVEKGLPNCPFLKHVIITELGDLFPFPKNKLINWGSKYLVNRYPVAKIPGAIPLLEMVKHGDARPFKDVQVALDDIAFLQYTGGTTGVAKAAMLTHRNMLSNVEQAEAWIGQELNKREEIIVTAIPLYHIFSLTANCLIFTKLGAKNLLITNPRDMKGFIKELKKEPFTVITGVNTLFNALLNQPSFASVDFSALKLSMGGGMAVQYAVAQRWKKLTGVALLEAYGLTETCPAAIINPFNLHEYTGAIGLPIPSTEVKIIDDEGKEVDLSQTGELCIRGPQVMKGYWNNPAETALVLSSDGWLRTGDIARMDNRGYVYLIDRKKDMILVSGFNVYPNEIEDVVMGMPEVLECAAVGEPHSTSGQIVKLFVVKKDPNLTEKQIHDYCHERLTGYKMPKVIVFKDQLPKSNVGKILRRELRA